MVPPVLFVGLLGAAFLAGGVDAMVGGGGLIQVPALFSALADSRPATVLATSKLAGLLGTASAAGRYVKSVRLPWPTLLPAVGAAFLASLGFRLTEYTATDGTDELWGAWLQRKGNPQDIVYANGRGPRLHHFAYPVPETRDIIHVCDVAASLGFAKNVERGPGRHGIGNALFVYLRDPDGHRVEFFIGHYQAIDRDEAPLRWDLTNTRRLQLWGLPARASWFNEATEFDGVTPSPPALTATPVTLETFLAGQA